MSTRQSFSGVKDEPRIMGEYVVDEFAVRVRSVFDENIKFKPRNDRPSGPNVF
jgi:hypothetical protein